MKVSKLRLLADEGVEYSAVLGLRSRGYDVAAIAEQARAITDEEVLRMAVEEGRVLLTNDKDFGQLIVRRQLEHCGVVLLRFKHGFGEAKLATLQLLLKKYSGKLPTSFNLRCYLTIWCDSVHGNNSTAFSRIYYTQH